MLEFCLAPSDLARLLRAPALTAWRVGRARTTRARIVWHDTPGGDFAAHGLALSQGANIASGSLWQLERLWPDGTGNRLPGCRAAVLAEAVSPDALGHGIEGQLQPVAAFQGNWRGHALGGDGGALSVLDGTLRGVAQDRPACRLMLQGEPRAMADLALRLGETARLRVPRAGLAAEAIALATGRENQPPADMQPLPPDVSVAEALRLATGQLVAHILHWAAEVPEAAPPTPVHQMRVAIRRLRSTLAVFRRVAQTAPSTAPKTPSDDAAWLDTLDARLRTLAAELGAARDWDVFLAETGADIGRTFAQDRRIARMLDMAVRRRAAAYALLAERLGSRSWATLELSLALLPTTQPWLDAEAASDRLARLQAPLPPFAADALGRRLKQVISPGKTLSALAAPALHDVRKDAKRLRYAAELFAPLFPAKQVRRYLSRLQDLQEALGAVNDDSVAAALMAQLGTGAGQAFAAGVVQGYGAGRSARATRHVERAWSRFYRATPFWD